MKLRHLLWVVLLAIAAGGMWYAVTLRNQPPEMAFAHVVRESIASSGADQREGGTDRVGGGAGGAGWSGDEALWCSAGRHVAAGAALIELDSARRGRSWRRRNRGSAKRGRNWK